MLPPDKDLHAYDETALLAEVDLLTEWFFPVALGRKADSASDIVRALEVYPDYPPALVERGKMKYSAGDITGARKDWQRAAATGQGQTAADAKRYLSELQGKGGR